MSRLIGRDYVLKNPGSVIHLFGIGVFLRMVASDKKGLLERAVDYYEQRGYAFPGQVGRAYRLAALVEARVAQVYGRMAEHFEHTPAAAELFHELQQEELEHSRLMQLCRFVIVLHPRLKFLPSIRDPEIRAILTQLRELRDRVGNLSLDEALEVTVAVEQGEINAIFERLLKQAETDAVRLFEGRLKEVEGHAQSVPKRVAALRRHLPSGRSRNRRDKASR